MRKGIPRKLRIYRSHRTQGGRGLELASIRPVDVVIVDYLMPEMNGQDVATEMRRLRPQAPIIMLSGAVEVPKQVLPCADAFIAKDHFGQPVAASDCTIFLRGPSEHY